MKFWTIESNFNYNNICAIRYKTFEEAYEAQKRDKFAGTTYIVEHTLKLVAKQENRIVREYYEIPGRVMDT